MRTAINEGKIMPVDRVVQALLTMVAIGLLCAAVVFVMIIAYQLIRRYCFKNVEYRRYFSQKGAFEGQNIELIEEFSNRSFFPLLRVDVETHIPSLLRMTGLRDERKMGRDKTGNTGESGVYQEFISRFLIMPFTRIRRHHIIVCEKRGVYNLESAKITFMKIELYLDSRAELMVYPKELKVDDINRINKCLQVSKVSERHVIRDPFSFAGVREYIVGDAMNMVNHKATARFGKLMVNESEFVLGRRIIVYINFQDGDTGIPVDQFMEILEKAMEYTAYIAGEALREGWQIGYRANCRTHSGGFHVRVQPGTGMTKYMEILEALADARTIFGRSIGYLMNFDIDERLSDSEVFFFTTYIDKSIQSRVDILESQGCVVNIIDLREVTAYEI